MFYYTFNQFFNDKINKTQDVCDADVVNPAQDWLNYKSGRCPFIRAIEPTEQQQITIAQTLHVHIDNVPQSLVAGALTDSDLYCSFQFPSLQTVNVSAIPRENGVICTTPTRPSLRSLKAKDAKGSADDVVARLSVTKVII